LWASNTWFSLVSPLSALMSVIKLSPRSRFVRFGIPLSASISLV